MNTMTHENYSAKIEYDDELELFRGEILNLTGSADFYGKTPKELKREFKKSLTVYLDACKEEGIEPVKHFSGKMNIRISPALHERLAVHAASTDQSINQLIINSVSQNINLAL